MNKHQRILVIGSGGAGKSTLSRKLSGILPLPLYHLDALYWNAGWVPTPREEFREKLKFILSKDRWIIDGNFDSTLELRAKYADLIIFLDFPNYVCLLQAFRRAWEYRGRTRPDMADGCHEKMDLEFARFIWRFPKDSRPGILNILEKSEAEVVILRSHKDVENWLRSLKAEKETAVQTLKK